MRYNHYSRSPQRHCPPLQTQWSCCARSRRPAFHENSNVAPASVHWRTPSFGLRLASKSSLKTIRFLIFMQRKRFGPGVLKDVQTVFDRYDSEQKSYLTRRELKLCMIACLGFKPPKVSGPG